MYGNKNLKNANGPKVVSRLAVGGEGGEGGGTKEQRSCPMLAL